MDKDNKTIGKNATFCIAVCGVLGSFSAYLSLPGNGPISSLPLLALCAFICAYIPGSNTFRIMLPTVMMLIFSLIKLADTGRAFFMAAIVLLLGLAAVLFRRMFSKNRKAFKLLAFALPIAAVIINTAVTGFFADALASQKAISDYSAKRYTSSTVIKGIYYDYTDGNYKSEVYARSAPTEIRTLTVSGGYVCDPFKNFVSKLLSESNGLSITSALRKAFPSDKFSLAPTGIVGYPLEKIDASSSFDYSPYTTYDLDIGSFVSLADFCEEARLYADALLHAGANYYSIRIVGGNGLCKLFQLTVNGSLSLGQADERLVTPIYPLPYFELS